MKRLLTGFFLTICLLFVSCFSLLLFAEENTESENVVKKEQIENADELAAVKAAINKDSSMLNSFGDDSLKSEPVTRSSNAIPLEMGYRLHFVTEPIVDAYVEGHTVAEIIPEEYTWRFPTVNGGKLTVKEKNGEWIVSGVTSAPIDSTVSPDVVDKGVVADAIRETEKLAGASEVTYINDPTCFTNFAYLLSDGTEYLIPFGPRPDFTGLENGKVYTFKEVVDTLNPYYEEENLDPFSDAGVGGIFSNQVSAEDPAAPAEVSETQQTNIWVVYIVAASVLFVGVCTVVLLLVRNKKRKEN